jgi:hypothetical protein
MGRGNKPREDLPPLRRIRLPPGPLATVGNMQRDPKWVWLCCRACPHRAPTAIAPFVTGCAGRDAAAICALFTLWGQRRRDDASKLGRHQYRMAAISGLAYGRAREGRAPVTHIPTGKFMLPAIDATEGLAYVVGGEGLPKMILDRPSGRRLCPGYRRLKCEGNGVAMRT